MIALPGHAPTSKAHLALARMRALAAIYHLIEFEDKR
jgi:hypothetical protein